MQRAEIFAQVQDVVRDVLDNESLKLSDATVAQDVDDWDSLAQLRIMIALEKRFSVKFDSDELTSLPNVGALVDTIAGKL